MSVQRNGSTTKTGAQGQMGENYDLLRTNIRSAGSASSSWDHRWLPPKSFATSSSQLDAAGSSSRKSLTQAFGIYGAASRGLDKFLDPKPKPKSKGPVSNSSEFNRIGRKGGQVIDLSEEDDSDVSISSDDLALQNLKITGSNGLTRPKSSTSSSTSPGQIGNTITASTISSSNRKENSTLHNKPGAETKPTRRLHSSGSTSSKSAEKVRSSNGSSSSSRPHRPSHRPKISTADDDDDDADLLASFAAATPVKKSRAPPPSFPQKLLEFEMRPGTAIALSSNTMVPTPPPTSYEAPAAVLTEKTVKGDENNNAKTSVTANTPPRIPLRRRIGSAAPRTQVETSLRDHTQKHQLLRQSTSSAGKTRSTEVSINNLSWLNGGNEAGGGAGSSVEEEGDVVNELKGSGTPFDRNAEDGPWSWHRDFKNRPPSRQLPPPEALHLEEKADLVNNWKIANANASSNELSSSSPAIGVGGQLSGRSSTGPITDVDGLPISPPSSEAHSPTNYSLSHEEEVVTSADEVETSSPRACDATSFSRTFSSTSPVSKSASFIKSGLSGTSPVLTNSATASASVAKVTVAGVSSGSGPLRPSSANASSDGFKRNTVASTSSNSTAATSNNDFGDPSLRPKSSALEERDNLFWIRPPSRQRPPPQALHLDLPPQKALRRPSSSSGRCKSARPDGSSRATSSIGFSTARGLSSSNSFREGSTSGGALSARLTQEQLRQQQAQLSEMMKTSARTTFTGSNPMREQASARPSTAATATRPQSASNSRQERYFQMIAEDVKAAAAAGVGNTTSWGIVVESPPTEVPARGAVIRVSEVDSDECSESMSPRVGAELEVAPATAPEMGRGSNRMSLPLGMRDFGRRADTQGGVSVQRRGSTNGLGSTHPENLDEFDFSTIGGCPWGSDTDTDSDSVLVEDFSAGIDDSDEDRAVIQRTVKPFGVSSSTGVTDEMWETLRSHVRHWGGDDER